VDAKLAQRVKQGDREAFGQLVQRYAPRARRVCRAILENPQDADDAAQDGFLAALTKIGTYDEARPFGPWLIRIIVNAARDLARKRKVRIVEEIPDDAVTAEPGPDLQAHISTLGDALKDALRTIPEREATAIVLYEVEGFTHREVAEILGVPAGTVRSDVHKARRRLRLAMTDWKED
jgi:RNA polymerase sigma-70 factor (ECF subfamily)